MAADVVKNVRASSKYKPVSNKVPSDADLEAIAAYITLGAGH